MKLTHCTEFVVFGWNRHPNGVCRYSLVFRNPYVVLKNRFAFILTGARLFPQATLYRGISELREWPS